MIPIHNHSEYSALDGYSKPVEIADRIEELGLPGAFLTDHGTVAGLAPFAEAMTWKNKKKKIRRDLFVGYGIEAYQATESRLVKEERDAYHLILLAKNTEGYRNLMRISDESHRSGFYYYPRLDWELLEKYKEGLIATSACMGSLISQRLMEDDRAPLYRMQEIFGDDFYIELHTYQTEEQKALNLEYASIAVDNGIKVIYANDAHYSHKEHWHIHEALMAAQYNQYMDAPKDKGNYREYFLNDNCFGLKAKSETQTVMEHTFKRIDRHHPPCLYIMGEQDVRESLSYLPQYLLDAAILNTDLIAEQCKDVVLPETSLHLPKYQVPKQYTDAKDMLESLVVEGLQERYEDAITPEILDRIEYEFDALIDAGLQDYFLIVWDFINWAENHGIIVGPGRGSVGGALTAYALGITSIDPLKHGLQFERFWNPGRTKGLPDIDVDFPMYGRQLVVDYVRRKYGDDRVLPISNHVRMRPKSAIDKAAKALYDPPPYGAVTNIKAIIHQTVDAGKQPAWDEMWEMLGKWAEQDGEPHPLDIYVKQFPDLFALAQSLEGRISTYSQHASAVVVSDVDLPEYLPARNAKEEGSDNRRILVTQAEMHGVEDAGFPKFDFLGLRNMDTAVIAAALSGEFGDPDLLLSEIQAIGSSMDGREVYVANNEAVEGLIRIIKHLRWNVNFDHLADSYWEQLDNGWALGLFQITKAAIRLGKKIQPRTVEEVGAIVALNRPGPLRDKDEQGRSTADRFVARRAGDEETVYPHPILEPILDKTYGDFLYQEQVIAYFRAIGYDMGEADHIRKMLGKKLVEEMKAEFPRYMERACQHMPEYTAEAIWHKIEEFSKYSFNKSHAIAYATVTAWCLYAKRKWPTEFIMASIMSDPDRVGEYIAEGKRLGVDISLPNINESDIFIRKVGDKILYGLSDIKGVGEGASNWIIQHRPYESFEHFEQVLESEAEAWREQPKDKREKRSPKQVVPANMVKALYRAGAFESIGDPRDMEPEDRAKSEEELLGFALTNIHAELLERKDVQKRLKTCNSPSVADTDERVSVRVVGIVKEVKKGRQSAKHFKHPNAEMAWVTIEWMGERLRFAVWHEQYEAYKWMLQPQALCYFDLKTGPKGASMDKGYVFT